VALALLVFGALIAGVVLRVQTGDGEVVITAESPDVQLLLMQGGKEIQVIDTRTQKRVTVPIGEYDVRLRNQPDGLEVKTDKITVRRGKEVLVTIQRVAPPALGPRPIAVDFGFPMAGAAEAGEIRSISLPWWGAEVGNLLSPDAKYVAIPSGAKPGQVDSLRVEEVATGKAVYERSSSGQPLTWISFTPDGKRLLFCFRAKDGYDVYLRDLPASKETRIHHFAGQDLRPVQLQLSEDGILLAWSVQDQRATTSTGVDVVGGERRQPFVVGNPDKPHVTMQTSASANGQCAAAAVSWDEAGPESRRVSHIVVKRLGGNEETRTSEVNGHVFNPFVDDLGRVRAIVYRRGEGYSVDWWEPDGKTWRQRVGALDSSAAYPDARLTRVAVYMGDNTIRIEDVGGWNVARFVVGPFERLKGCWLSGDGSVLAVQTDTRLRLYRLPPIFGIAP
jgi:hypothetical protein